jgi:hypothetical protein
MATGSSLRSPCRGRGFKCSAVSDVVGEVAELAYEAPRVGKRLVAIVFVEVSGVVVKSVDDNETRGDDLGCRNDSARRVGEEHAAEPLPVVCSVEREAGDQHSRDPVRRASPERSGQHLALDDVPNEGEVSDDRVRLGPYPGSPGTNGLGV